MDKQELSRRFRACYDTLKQEFLQDIKELGINEPAYSWIETMCDYNAVGGKMNRGLSVVETALLLSSGSIDDAQLKSFIALGWCIEWLQASFLIADDIMDSSLTRRGQKCWYRCPKVGMVAINDCFVLHSMLFKTLKRHFGRHPAYTALFELFIDTKLRTELGQLLDLLTAPADGPKDVSKFNMDLYRKIIRFKTAYYSFHLPVVASLIALDYQKEASLTELESILIDLGELFQIQDDFLDCYGDPEVMGKIGTDIQEGKCTWLIVKALENQRLTLEMRQKLELHYGQKDLESAIIIKDIYRQLDLESEFRTLEKTMKLELLERIRLIGKSNDALGAVLESFGCRIFGRKK